MKKSMKIKPIDTTYQSVKHILEEARKKAYSIVNFAFSLRGAEGECEVEQRTPDSPSAPLRENQEFETDAPPGHCSTRAMVQAYWNIGMIIVEEEQKGKATAGYGEYLISELAARLTAEFGKGFTQTNLRYMRLFYLSFEIMNASASQSPPEQIHHALRDELPVIRPELSWTHYRLLLKVERSDVREFYLDECIVANWSTRQLELEMKSRKQ